MSAEHGEHSSESHEKASVELEAARTEQLDKMHETASEHDPTLRAEKQAEHDRESARKIIDRQEPEDESVKPETAAKSTPRTIPFFNHHLNYVQTLASVQRKLSPVSRSFSKVIHQPLVEKTSEALENTVARPSLLFGTTWTALIVGSIFYLTAHHYGYALSGSELLFSFIVGAVIGILIEGIWIFFSRPTRH
jgi:hypothetical protein